MIYESEREASRDLCSVVCTTYNHSRFSRAAIESIAAQDHRPLEVVIVDDGSTDENVEVIRAAIRDAGLPHKIIAQENTGNVAMNANRAIREAKGEFLVLTSLDDLLLPDCISTKMKRMLKDTNLVMVGNSMKSEINAEGRLEKAEVPDYVHGREQATAAELLEAEFVSIGLFFVQGTAFRADFIEALGGFDEDMAGDDLVLRTKIWLHLIANPQLSFTFIPQPGFAYRKHGENLNLNTFRQVRTVLDWRDRFFPDRSLPDLARKWVISYFNQCIGAQDYEALERVISTDPEMHEIYTTYSKSWKFRRRRIRYAIKRLMGAGPTVGDNRKRK